MAGRRDTQGDRDREPWTGRRPDERVAGLANGIRRLGARFVHVTQHLRAASDVNDTDFVALTILSDTPGLTAGELATRLRRSPGATSTVIDRLEGAGHLQRVRDDQDRRVVTLWLTDQPNRVAAAALAPLLDRLAAEFADDHPAEIDQATATLSRIETVLEDYLSAEADTDSRA